MTPLTISRQRASERDVSERTSERTCAAHMASGEKPAEPAYRDVTYSANAVLKHATRAAHRERVLVLGLVSAPMFY